MTKPLIPDPLNTDTECDRFYHLDVPELDDSELTDEVNYIRALLWQVPANDWLRERVNVLENELSKRRWAAKDKAKALRG